MFTQDIQCGMIAVCSRQNRIVYMLLHYMYRCTKVQRLFMTQYGLVMSRRTLTIVYTLQAFPSTPVKPTHMGSWRWIPSVFRRWSFMSEQMASTLLKSWYLTRKVNCICRGLLKLTITFVLAMRDSLLMICSDNTCQSKHQSASLVLPLLCCF